jgi:high-affinity nickel permease
MWRYNIQCKWDILTAKTNEYSIRPAQFQYINVPVIGYECGYSNTFRHIIFNIVLTKIYLSTCLCIYITKIRLPQIVSETPHRTIIFLRQSIRNLDTNSLWLYKVLECLVRNNELSTFTGSIWRWRFINKIPYLTSMF